MIPYRDDNLTEIVPYVTKAINALDIIVLVGQAFVPGEELFYLCGAIPVALPGHDVRGLAISAGATVFIPCSCMAA